MLYRVTATIEAAAEDDAVEAVEACTGLVEILDISTGDPVIEDGEDSDSDVESDPFGLW